MSVELSEVDAFRNLGAFRAAHLNLQDELRRYRSGASGAEAAARAILVQEIRLLIARGQQSGEFLQPDVDREAARAWLEYWTAELRRLGEPTPGPTRPRPYNPARVEALRPRHCPYKGLHPFGESEADRRHFRGRDRTVQELIDQLRDDRLLLLLGPSGSGKTSMIQAGVIPALQRGDLVEVRNWHHPAWVMTPGTRPFHSLIQTVQEKPAAANWLEEYEKSFLQSPDRLATFVDALPKRRETGKRLKPAILVVDQLEELFVLGVADGVRQAFIQNLRHLAQQTAPGDVVILVMRSEFESLLHLLPKEIARNVYRLPPMTEAELREAIVEPARAVGLDFDPQVVRDLVTDVQSGPHGIGLTLLQFALHKLFHDRSAPFAITRVDYERIGRAHLALRASFDACLKRLEPDRDMVQRLLLRLLRSSEGQEVGVRILREELARDLTHGCPAAESAAQRAALSRTIETLRAEGIIRLTPAPRMMPDQQAEWVEIAHDSLARTWPTLDEWLQAREVAVFQRRRFETLAVAWDEGGRKEGFLEGHALAEAEAFLGSESARGLGDNSRVRALIEMSRARVAQQEAVMRVQVERATKAEREATAVRLATQAQLVARSQLDLALLLAVEACRIGETPEVRNTQPEARDTLLELVGAHVHLVKYLRESAEMVYSLAFNPQGTRMVSAEYSGAILLWEMPSGRFLGQLHAADEHEIDSLMFHPDGRRVAAASRSGSVRMWDVETRQFVFQFAGALKAVNAVAFSPDGQYLASAGDDGLVRLWHVEDGRPEKPFKVSDHGVLSVAFSPDGSRLAAAGRDSSVYVWNPAQPQAVPLLIGKHDDNIACLAFHPTKPWLASGSRDRTVRLWDVEERRTLAVLRGHTALIWNVAFDPGGRILASASRDRTVCLWDVQRRRFLTRLTAHRDEVNAVAFNPQNRQLVTASDDRTLALWDLDQLPERLPQEGEVGHLAFSPDGDTMAVGGRSGSVELVDLVSPDRPQRTLIGHRGEVLAVAFSPEGTILATGGVDRLVRLWNVAQGSPMGEGLQGHSDEIYSLAFSPRRPILASGARDGQVFLWSTATRELVETLPAGRGGMICVAFSADGRWLATGGEDGLIVVWDVQDGLSRPAFRFRHSQQVNCLAFNPGEETLALGSDDASVVLIDLRSPAKAPLYDLAGERLPGLRGIVPNLSAGSDRCTLLEGHSAPVWELSYSRDGRWLASGAQDDRVMLWDLSVAPPQGRPLTGHTGGVSTVAFHPNGKLLASGGDDQQVILWRVVEPSSLDSCVEAAQQKVNRSLTEAERRKYRVPAPTAELSGRD